MKDILLVWQGLLAGAGNRRLALTKSGLLGIVPSLAAAEDIVVIFAGARAPSVLHPVQDGFHYLGSACIHGVMYGEAWQDVQQDNTTFRLI